MVDEWVVNVPWDRKKKELKLVTQKVLDAFKPDLFIAGILFLALIMQTHLKLLGYLLGYRAKDRCGGTRDQRRPCCGKFITSGRGGGHGHFAGGHVKKRKR